MVWGKVRETRWATNHQSVTNQVGGYRKILRFSKNLSLSLTVNNYSVYFRQGEISRWEMPTRKPVANFTGVQLTAEQRRRFSHVFPGKRKRNSVLKEAGDQRNRMKSERWHYKSRILTNESKKRKKQKTTGKPEKVKKMLFLNSLSCDMLRLANSFHTARVVLYTL